jgi:hypothetical protein
MDLLSRAMFLSRCGICLGLVVAGAGMIFLKEYTEGAFQLFVAIVICPIWDDYWEK